MLGNFRSHFIHNGKAWKIPSKYENMHILKCSLAEKNKSTTDISLMNLNGIVKSKKKYTTLFFLVKCRENTGLGNRLLAVGLYRVKGKQRVCENLLG